MAQREGDGRHYSRIVGMDPGADWLLGPGLRDFLPPGGGEALIPFIMHVGDKAALAVVERLLVRSRTRDRPGSPFILLGPGGRRRPNLRLGQHFTAFAPKAFFDALAQGGDDLEALRVGPKRIQLGLPLRASSVARQRSGHRKAGLAGGPVHPPEQGWCPGTVVVGAIDDGIAFANARFRRADGTSRVEAFWIQDDVPGATPPADYGYGREIGKGGIDALLQECTQAGWLNEDKFYRRCSLADFTSPLHRAVAWRTAHGTHVLDLAAGYGMAEDRADRPVIGVQLPVASTASQSGAGLEPFVHDAICYILDRARRLTGTGDPPLPVVINFSYGTHAGPHDGTSLLEQAIDDAVAGANSPVRIVLPAGNTHAARCHAEVAFKAPGEVVHLHMRVQPDDQTPSTVQFWLPYAGPGGPAQSRVSLSVETPDGVQSPWIDEAAGQQFSLLSNGQEYCLGLYSFVPTPTGRGVFRIDLSPTGRVLPSTSAGDPGTVAPSGVWIIRLRNTLLAPGDKVEAWIERDDLLYGYPRRGRQAYFDERCYVRFDKEGRPVEEDPANPPCRVQRAGMINAIGTGGLAAVVGGFVRRNREAASYSAGGPITPARGSTLDPALRKPDALAVSDDSRVHSGVLAAGSRSGSTVAISGTSVACPQITRWCADQLATGAPSDRAAIKQLALAAEGLLPAAAPPLPPGRGGWGRIEFAGTMQGPRTRYWT